MALEIETIHAIGLNLGIATLAFLRAYKTGDMHCAEVGCSCLLAAVASYRVHNTRKDVRETFQLVLGYAFAGIVGLSLYTSTFSASQFGVISSLIAHYALFISAATAFATFIFSPEQIENAHDNVGEVAEDYLAGPQR